MSRVGRYEKLGERSPKEQVAVGHQAIAERLRGRSALHRGVYGRDAEGRRVAAG